MLSSTIKWQLVESTNVLSDDMLRVNRNLQKVNLKKVQQVLRHRKQTTTEIYVEGNYTDTRDVMGLLELKNLENFR